jgi:integrase/recombinase XerD
MTQAIVKRADGTVVKKRQVQQLKAKTKVAGQKLPEYLYPEEVMALMVQAAHAQARLLMLCQWRAGLRVSEALALEAADISLRVDDPTIRVRKGKGNKPRVVPLHAELAAAFRNYLDFNNSSGKRGRIIPYHRSTAWRWVQDAARRAIELHQLPPGKEVGTHTLRHSAARHWLASGVPINTVSHWLGHADIQTTLIYLRILPDPTGYMERVP